MSVLAAFFGTALATGFLVHLALAVGWVDQTRGQEHRKLHRQPVALVGGAAILLGVLLSLTLSTLDEAAPGTALLLSIQRLPWAGLLTAFLLGLADDLAPDGLTARVKFAGQLLVAALVAALPGEAFAEASFIQCVGLGLFSLVAMNAVNLFDHADGLVGTLALLALMVGTGPFAALFAAACAGYLPFNLKLRHGAEEGPADVGEEQTPPAPYAMLGDSGSHLLGVLIATTPWSWWFLAIPILDMARVVLGRLRRGTPFWRGDRTHVGHRLQDIGFGGTTTALLVGLMFLPGLVTIALMDGLAPLATGLLAGGALYFAMLVMADGGELPDALSPEGNVDVGEFPDEVSVSDVFARASGLGDDSWPLEAGPRLSVLSSRAGEDGDGPAGEPAQDPSRRASSAGENASGPFAAPGPERRGEDSA